MASSPQSGNGNAVFGNEESDSSHITDNNERRRLALAEIDKAPFGWYHVRAVVVAGVGFFTDAYDVSYSAVLSPATCSRWYPGLPRRRELARVSDSEDFRHF